MDPLYGRSTRRLSALGRSVADIHQTCVKASFTRIRSMVTQGAGLGNLAGLKQTNCWHRWKPPFFRNASIASIARVDIVGLPGSHALPISMTTDPPGAR